MSKKNKSALVPFFCNDCQLKFRAKPLAGRNNSAVQHFCPLYRKIVTRKIGFHSNKCMGNHGKTPCVYQRISGPDSDCEDETKKKYQEMKQNGTAILYKNHKRRNNDSFVVDDNEPPMKKQKKLNKTVNNHKSLQNIYNPPNSIYSYNNTYSNNDIINMPPIIQTKKKMRKTFRSGFFAKTPIARRKDNYSNYYTNNINNNNPDIILQSTQ
mmetsp:Transcript_98891/g.121072  ORF Transcript_98891/g.121072 Transcript_98891/m.121072 type:complete len:211 (+) Transcript_98891:42-674(+)